MKIWPIGEQSPSPKATMASGQEVFKAASSSDGKSIIGIHGDNRRLKVWDSSSGGEGELSDLNQVTVTDIMWAESSSSKAYAVGVKSGTCTLMELSMENQKVLNTVSLGDYTDVKLSCTLKDNTYVVCLAVDAKAKRRPGYDTCKALAVSLSNGEVLVCCYHETKSIHAGVYEKPVFCATKLDEETVLLGCHGELLAWQPPDKECYLIKKEGMRTWLRHSLRFYFKSIKEPGSDLEHTPVTASVVAEDRASIVSGDENGSMVWWRNVSKATAPNVDHGILLSGHSAAVSPYDLPLSIISHLNTCCLE